MLNTRYNVINNVFKNDFNDAFNKTFNNVIYITISVFNVGIKIHVHNQRPALTHTTELPIPQ